MAKHSTTTTKARVKQAPKKELKTKNINKTKQLLKYKKQTGESSKIINGYLPTLTSETSNQNRLNCDF